ncbi:GlsB/YeaQ/YmgE family stress response membrane protein [Dokdonella soli]|uniref:GlsB/YeaQ/YmgE family stress response membrane protein n=1 Tax=Dokdonella soli TaxID=529810 RepID=A0ABN1IC61_9GAMM
MEVFGGTHNLFMVFIIGLIVGVIAKFLTPGRDPGGFIITAILGIVGSFVATWLGKMIGWYQPGHTAGFIGSVIGAIIVLVVYHLIRRRGT